MTLHPNLIDQLMVEEVVLAVINVENRRVHMLDAVMMN